MIFSPETLRFYTTIWQLSVSLLFVLRCQREFFILFHVCASDQGHQFTIVIDYGKLAWNPSKTHSKRLLNACITTVRKLIFVNVDRNNKVWKFKLISQPLTYVPFLLFWRIRLASFKVTSAFATTRSSNGVITWGNKIPQKKNEHKCYTYFI